MFPSRMYTVNVKNKTKLEIEKNAIMTVREKIKCTKVED